MSKTKDETLIVRACIAYIKSLGGDAWHVHGSALQRKGEPDLDGWLPDGRHLKIEVKTEYGKVSEIQKYRLDIYKKAGYTTGIVKSVEELKDLLCVS